MRDKWKKKTFLVRKSLSNWIFLVLNFYESCEEGYFAWEISYELNPDSSVPPKCNRNTYQSINLISIDGHRWAFRMLTKNGTHKNLPLWSIVICKQNTEILQNVSCQERSSCYVMRSSTKKGSYHQPKSEHRVTSHFILTFDVWKFFCFKRSYHQFEWLTTAFTVVLKRLLTNIRNF